METLNEYTMSDKEFKIISQCVHQLCGIVLRPEKKPMVNSRLSRRLRDLNLNDYTEYLKYLNSSGSSTETSLFINAITTNLTKFFRESHHFDHLKSEIMPLLKNKSNIKIWSAGCSTGEEPYSIGITVVSNENFNKNVKILATDIDTKVLETARLGLYKDINEIPSEYRSKFFTKNENNYKIDKSIQNIITFNQLNLLEDWPMKGPFDLIFCRNTVIYFDKKTQAKLFDKMANLLVPDGFLYIGHSENLHKVTDRFELKGKTIYQRVS